MLFLLNCPLIHIKNLQIHELSISHYYRQGLNFLFFKMLQIYTRKIVAAFRGSHVSPAKQLYATTKKV